jgi:hypothetical protein
MLFAGGDETLDGLCDAPGRGFLPGYAGPIGTYSGTLVFSAAFDADGSTDYQSIANLPEQLYAIDLSSPSPSVTPLPVAAGHYAYKPSFSQDGRLLFFDSVPSDMTRSIQNPWAFTQNLGCTIPWMAVSPDGTKVAFDVDYYLCTAKAGIYVVPIDATSLPPRINDGTAFGHAAQWVQFNRAGDRLYYIGGDYLLHSERLDGTDVQTVASTGSFQNVDALGHGAVVVNDAYFVYGSAGLGIHIIPFDGKPTVTEPIANMYQATGLTWTP